MSRIFDLRRRELIGESYLRFRAGALSQLAGEFRAAESNLPHPTCAALAGRRIFFRRHAQRIMQTPVMLQIDGS